jgi:NADH dehydrogenase FAD-containing subunit
MMRAQPKVVVVGGGFGGLESTFSLRSKLGDRVDLTLVSDRDYFLFKLNTISIPIGEEPEHWHVLLEKPTRRTHIAFTQARVRAIDPQRQTVQLDGEPLAYDSLEVATGAEMRPQEIPGLQDHALTVWAELALVRLRTRFQQLLAQVRRGAPQRLLFLVLPNNRCSGPLYEMVLMTDTWLRRQ